MNLKNSPFKCIVFSFLLSYLSTTSLTVLAWDSVGHRLTASVAVSQISDQTRQQLISILRNHPRFNEDFLNQIPDFIDQSDALMFDTWLLGQAAYWPDIVRGLPDQERERFNRPNWHYTDGAWVRDGAQFQGNIYLGDPESSLIQGETASLVLTEQDAHNVVTAIDYNAQLLLNPIESAEKRAVALCWVLHLIGDIHQPLHTGSLFTADLFASGDRGGNRISTGSRSNLHSDWDGALRSEGIAGNLPLIMTAISEHLDSNLEYSGSDWTAWMAESRAILADFVYTAQMREAIAEADRNSDELASQSLNNSYIENMKTISRQRIGLAGVRLANLFKNELN